MSFLSQKKLLFTCIILCVITISCKSVKKSDADYIYPEDFGAVANDNKSDSKAIQKALNAPQGILVFDENGVYHLDHKLFVNTSKVIIGNNATLICAPKIYHYNLIEIGCDNVAFNNLNFVSENIHQFAAYSETQNFTSNLRAISAHPKTGNIRNLSIKNCSFENFAYVTKLNKTDKLTIDSVQASGSMMGIFCEDCSQISINHFESDRINANSRFTHHIYLNSCQDISIQNCSLENGAGQGINIKSESVYPSNKNVKIKNINLIGTRGFFLQRLDKCYLDSIDFKETNALFTLADGVDSLFINNVKSNASKTVAIRSIVRNAPPNFVAIENFKSQGPINLYCHNIKHLKVNNSHFENFLSITKRKGDQNVIYIKEGYQDGKVKFENCIFEQYIKHNQNRIIRNESSTQFIFRNNIVKINSNPIDQLSFLSVNTESTFENNSLQGVRKLKLPASKGIIKQIQN